MKLLSLVFFIMLCLNCVFAEDMQASDNPVLLMKTSMGDIYIELYPDKAPVTVANFLRYVEEGYYEGLIFHRVIPKFMVQCGGFEPGMQMRPPQYPPIKNEAKNGLKNLRGTLAMARTNYPDSATAQFFINVVDNGFLDHGVRGYGYAVFGKVLKGMEVADKIAEVATKPVDVHENVPAETIKIFSIRKAALPKPEPVKSGEKKQEGK
jgi:cyclophilin family peptidyl-prolyl cis-trans isomerase